MPEFIKEVLNEAVMFFFSVAGYPCHFVQAVSVNREGQQEKECQKGKERWKPVSKWPKKTDRQNMIGPGTVKNSVYPELAKWMLDLNMSQERLAEATDMSVGTLHRLLTGENVNKRFIDAILETTGMTYEEAFRRETPKEKRK